MSVRIAVTPGDHEGIGPELALRLWQQLGSMDGVEFTLVGPATLWRRAADLVGVPAGGLRTLEVDPAADPQWSHLAGVGEVATAVRGCLDGRFDAVCTGPLHKATLLEGGFPYMGHTPYLAALCGRDAGDAVMVFAGGRLTVALATVHVPLARVPAALTEPGIVRAALGLEDVVRRGWGAERPRIAVCGLNPHAGEEGRLGHEDAQVVAPAVARLREQGVDASGPWPADTVFGRALRGDFDAVVAAYHDQGLVAVKTLDFGCSVNITAGLPVVRTSVDHGTARDIAWQGIANADGIIAAARMAIRLARPVSGEARDAGSAVAARNHSASIR